MKIANSFVLLAGTQQNSLLSERVQSTTIESSKNPKKTAGVELSLSTQTREQQSVKTSSSVSDSTNGYQYHSNSFLAQQLTESVTKLNVSISSVHGQLAESSNGSMLSIHQIAHVERKETLSIEAVGNVQTEDGRSIDFMLALDFKRDISQEQSALFNGKVTLVDPLMLNLNGGPVELADQYFEFDLNADGKTEKISQTAKGSGYLVFDKNGDGVINDGTEMFGPQTGFGFAELAQYDDDKNGWIDSNDAIFEKLSIMSFENGRPVLLSAKDTGLGALYLGAVASDYNLLNKNGKVLGNIKNTGVGLNEQGGTILLQEVHLSITSTTSSKASLSLNSEAAQISTATLAFSKVDLSAWVSTAMQGFTATETEGQSLEDRYWASMPKGMNFSSNFFEKEEPKDPQDDRIRVLNATLDSLREMRKKNHLWMRPTNIYKSVGRMG